jgi:Zn-dependent peptidase ImmA (M78 family)
VGFHEPFPRDLEEPILLALPLAILKLPHLTLASATAELETRGVEIAIRAEDRPLRGCLIAYRGNGLIIIDSCDSLEERRFTLAHEAAHFIVDYLEPRTQAVDALGPDVIPVLDGDRSPTVRERFEGIMRRTCVGVHSHLMTRTPKDKLSQRIHLAESDADQLAIELLAPVCEARRRLKGGRSEGDASALLSSEFGLPEDIAYAYVAFLSQRQFQVTSFLEWLGPEASSQISCRTSPGDAVTSSERQDQERE